MAACEKAVLRAAIEGVTRCKDDAKVGKGDAAIRGHQRADFWGSQAVPGTYTARFVVIPGINGPILIPPGGLYPDWVVLSGSDHGRCTLTEIEEVCACHGEGISGRGIHVEGPIHPHTRAVPVDNRRRVRRSRGGVDSNRLTLESTEGKTTGGHELSEYWILHRRWRPGEAALWKLPLSTCQQRRWSWTSGYRRG